MVPLVPFPSRGWKVPGVGAREGIPRINKGAPRFKVRCALVTHPNCRSLAATLDLQRLDKFKGQRGLRGEGDVPFAGESRASGACGRADEAANQSAFTTAGEPADESAATCTAAHHTCGALALADAGLGRGCGLNVVVLIADGDAGEGERKDGAALESAGGLGVFDDTRSPGAFGNSDPAIDLDGTLHGCGKCLAWSADLGAHGLIKNNRDDRPCRDDERLGRRRRRCRLFYRRGSGGIGASRSGRIWRGRRGLLIGSFLATKCCER